MLDVEFGGMNDVMYRMYRRLGDGTVGGTNSNAGAAAHLRLARLFDKPRWFEPLAAGRDALAGLHANTHLAQVRSAEKQS